MNGEPRALTELPPEVHHEILHHLKKCDFGHMRQVNYEFSKLPLSCQENIRRSVEKRGINESIDLFIAERNLVGLQYLVDYKKVKPDEVLIDSSEMGYLMG